MQSNSNLRLKAGIVLAVFLGLLLAVPFVQKMWKDKLASERLALVQATVAELEIPLTLEQLKWKDKLASERLALVLATVAELEIPLTLEQLLASMPIGESPATAMYREAEAELLASELWALADASNQFLSWPLLEESSLESGLSAVQIVEVIGLFEALPDFLEAIQMLQQAGQVGPFFEETGGTLSLSEFYVKGSSSSTQSIGSLLQAATLHSLERGDLAQAILSVEASFAYAETRRIRFEFYYSHLVRSACESAKHVLPHVQDPKAMLAGLPMWGEFFSTTPLPEPTSFLSALEMGLIAYDYPIGILVRQDSVPLVLDGDQVPGHVLKETRCDYLEHHMAILEALKLPGPEALARVKALVEVVAESDSVWFKLTASGLETRLKNYFVIRSSCLLLLLGGHVLQYRQDHGVWPGTIAVCAPDFPVDPLTNEPFLLAATSTGIRISSPEWSKSQDENLTWLLE